MPLQPSPESKGQDTAKSAWALRDKESKLNKMIAKKKRKKVKSKLKFTFVHLSQLMISATKHHMVLCKAINMLLFQTHFYWHFPSVNRCSWLVLCLWAQKTWASTFVHLQEANATCQWEHSLCNREYQLYIHSVCRTAEQACITVSTCGSFLPSCFS